MHNTLTIPTVMTALASLAAASSSPFNAGQPISIPKGDISLAGHLYQPTNASTTPPTIVVVHPGGGVKEQAAGLYAKKLSERGFIAITFDAAHQGESGGLPRLLENPASRVSDVSAVVDYAQQQDFVNATRLGVLGICAGGAYGAAATARDHRIRALATVSMVNIGDGARADWYGNSSSIDIEQLMEDAADNLVAQAAGAEPTYDNYVPPQPDESTPYDLVQASDYYLIPRAQHPNAPNRMLTTSFPLIASFDAYDLADQLLTQPTLLIAGADAGSLWHTDRLDQVLGGATQRLTIPGAGHMDLYDGVEEVALAIRELEQFYGEYLA
ncbi:hypothetical protein CBER1_09719 [Cercospora berteroae]|uniref:PET hydrolase/cutinase-like domain-containing protein n=1 Tax=Cercospora berteroae TaxID=357750 RepID=A0A2S6CDY2_9PEZI|nr:hypothetical protein CBER1_09719 [Cercospora berteroae]